MSAFVPRMATLKTGLLLLTTLLPDVGGFVAHGPGQMIQAKHCHSSAVCAAGIADEALFASLERVAALRGDVVVVKFGGHAMTNDELAAQFASDMSLLQSLGLRPVVVHGGGPQIGEMLKRLEIESNFVNGLRVTDAPTMEVVEMVLCGKLNKKIASAINAAGGRAIGLSGKDDALVTARRKLEPDLGLVGEPHGVNSALLTTLLDEGVVPVIAPVATGEGGASYNVNADTMAGVIASALDAKQLLLLTDVAGVLDGAGELMPKLSTAAAKQLTEDGTATGGMIPKLGTAIDAVRGGTGSAVIMDGRVPHCSLVHLFGESAVGTAVTDTM